MLRISGMRNTGRLSADVTVTPPTKHEQKAKTERGEGEREYTKAKLEGRSIKLNM